MATDPTLKDFFRGDPADFSPMESLMVEQAIIIEFARRNRVLTGGPADAWALHNISQRDRNETRHSVQVILFIAQ